jgi:hypothetical protein
MHLLGGFAMEYAIEVEGFGALPLVHAMLTGSMMLAGR